MAKAAKVLNSLGKEYIPKVMVCIPFYGQMPHTMSFFLRNLASYGIPGYDVMLIEMESTIITFARCELVDRFMQSGCDYLFFIDDDIGFEHSEMIEKDAEYGIIKMITMMKQILDHRMNICGGYYVRRKPPHTPQIYETMEDGGDQLMTMVDPPEDEVVECAAVATGFMCVNRRVFVAFEEDFNKKTKTVASFKEWNSEPTNEKADKRLTEYLKICKPDIAPPYWTDYVFDENRKQWSKRGEDIYFCLKARELGFKIYCDTGVRLGHNTDIFVKPSYYDDVYKEIAIEEQIKELKHFGIYKEPENGSSEQRNEPVADVPKG